MSEGTQAELKFVHLDICPYGDMEIGLTTSTAEVTYRVSSHQLCSGSPVFRAMLGPQSSFSEANGLRQHQRLSTTTLDSKGSFFRITAEEYDPTALATVLYVLHGRAQHIPESVTFKNLLEIAIICDYYDCAATMRPWDETWMSPLRSLTSKPGYESWLFIAWVFRDQNTFGEMTARFSKSGVMVEGEFGIIVGGNMKRLDCHLPQGIINAIAEQRAKIGEEVVRTCRGFITMYEDDTPIKCPQGVRMCDYVIFAGLCKGFKSMNLFNPDTGFQANLQLEAMFLNIKTVLRDGLEITLKNFKYHSSCYSKLSVVQSLQSLLEQIKPLYLTSFSRKPAVSDTRHHWEKFLRKEGTFSPPTWKSAADVVHLDIYKYGDMEIFLKTNTIHATYTVSSHQLRTGSPVVRDLLGQGSAFQEHTRYNPDQNLDSGLHAHIPIQASHYQLEVAKDFDPTAFAIVLYILHARVQNLPERMDFENLISVISICDYYDCSAQLHPWHGKWVDRWRKYSSIPGYENWLFAAWALREDHIFKTLTKNFVKNGRPPRCKRMISVEDEQESVALLSKFIPQAIRDAMIEQRNATTEKIVQVCRDIYEQYNNDTATKCLIAPHSIVGKVCDHFIFGELHLGFKAARLLQADVFSFPPNISPNSFVVKLNKLRTAITSSFDHSIMGGGSHSACAISVEALAHISQAALDDIKPLSLTMFGRKQAEKQVVPWESVLIRAEEVSERGS